MLPAIYTSNLDLYGHPSLEDHLIAALANDYLIQVPYDKVVVEACHKKKIRAFTALSAEIKSMI